MDDDRAQIENLYMRYACLLDEHRFEEWLDCFTEQGALTGPRYGRHQGHDDLRSFIGKYKAATETAQIRHVISNVMIEIEGEHASGSCYVVHYRTYRGHTEIAAIGCYRDQLQKVNGQWRYEIREALLDYSGSWT